MTPSEEEEARQKAEARRLRILQSQKERMGLVEGTIKKEEEVEAEEKAAKAPVSASAAARMAAMRRRRFKGKETAKTPAPAVEEAKSVEENKPSAETKVDDAPAEKETGVSEAEQPATETKKDDPVVESKKEEEQKQPEEQAIPAATAPKKYVGVAKMRRRMVKERQAKKEQEENKAEEEPEALKKLKTKALKTAKSPVAVLKFPIYMSAVTVFLLFLAGLDVGLDQGKMDYGINKELLQIHTELAPRELGLRFASVFEFSAKETDAKRKLQDEFGGHGHVMAGDEHDEFAEVNKSPEEIPENIDPLFGVDLDKYAAGDGFFLMVARLAIKVHRLILAVVYYFPIRTFNNVIAGIYNLVDSPPLFCLVAIVIRQLIGKAILGAQLPAIVEDATQHKDATSMVKNFVGNFVLKAFPTAVSMYDAWQHLRADMYVILCGFLVGVAWTHSTTAGFSAGWESSQQQEPGGIMEEEIPPPIQDQVPPEEYGGTDEL